MQKHLPNIFRFLLVPVAVLLVYTLGVTVYFTIDTTVAPGLGASTVILFALAALLPLGSVVVGSSLAPQARVVVGLVILAGTAVPYFTELHVAAASSRLIPWLVAMHAAAGLFGLFIVVKHFGSRPVHL